MREHHKSENDNYDENVTVNRQSRKEEKGVTNEST